MARTKQVKPVERTPSSEYVTRQNGTPAKRTPSFNVAEQVKANGAALANKVAIAPAETGEQEAGIVQLVIAVAGIYGSLYALPTYCPFSSRSTR